MVKGSAPFVCHRLYCCLPPAPHHHVSECKHPRDRKDRGEPGRTLLRAHAVVPSAAGAVVFAAAGFFVGAGVTLSAGGANVTLVDGVGAFVAIAGKRWCPVPPNHASNHHAQAATSK